MIGEVKASLCLILTKLSVKLPWGYLSTLTPSSAPSRTSLSSMTAGRYFEEMKSLDKVPDVRSWWNFQESFPGEFLVPWHHLQLNQEHPCPPKLQEETWRIGGVLTSFLMLDLDGTFSNASLGFFEDPDTVSSSIKNLPALQNSRKRLGGNKESRQGSWC